MILENPLLTSIFDQIHYIVAYTHVSLFFIEGAEVTSLTYRGPGLDCQAAITHFKLADPSISTHLYQDGLPVLMPTAQGDPPLTLANRKDDRMIPNDPFYGAQSWMVFPLHIGAQISILLAVAHREPNIYSDKDVCRVQGYLDQVRSSLENAIIFRPDVEQTLPMLASEAAIAIERAGLVRREPAEPKSSIRLARLQEQQRIAQALHDTVTQILFSIGLEVKWCRQNLQLDRAGKEHLFTIERLVERSSHELRSAIFALRDHDLGGEVPFVDLVKDQLNEFQKETRIETTLVVSPNLGALPHPVNEAIYRILRESLMNIRKHANATDVMVSLQREDCQVRITIQDNGLGLPKDLYARSGEPSLHFGIQTMQELVASLGGELYVGNNDDHGAIIKASFPLHR